MYMLYAEEGTAAAGAGNKVERWRAGAVGVAVTRVAGQQQGIEWRSWFWGILIQIVSRRERAAVRAVVARATDAAAH